MLDAPDANPVAGGTILGIHNLAIVFPQFIVSVLAFELSRGADEYDRLR